MTDDIPAIRAELLSRHFGQVRAVDQLSVLVNPGEIFGLVGPDGAGKTTVMRLLAGILSATAGDAWVGGHSIRREREAIKEQTGYMSQGFSLYADLTVLENITFYADIYGVPNRERASRIDELLSFSELGQFRGRLAGNLSGGMKQKLSLCCVLVHKPRVLLLDEPTNGVDLLARREFWRILEQLLSDGTSVFVSTSHLDEAERCGRIGLMHGGRLIADGAPDDVKRLLRGVILELETSDPRQALLVLREQPVVLQANLFGDRVHVTTTTVDHNGALGDALQKRGILVYAIRETEASLDDVFVSVLTEPRASG